MVAGTFNLSVPVDALFFIGSQLVATSHTGKIGVWNSMTQHWQVHSHTQPFNINFLFKTEWNRISGKEYFWNFGYTSSGCPLFLKYMYDESLWILAGNFWIQLTGKCCSICHSGNLIGNFCWNGETSYVWGHYFRRWNFYILGLEVGWGGSCLSGSVIWTKQLIWSLLSKRCGLEKTEMYMR